MTFAVVLPNDTFARSAINSEFSLPPSQDGYSNGNVNPESHHITNDICETLKYNRKVQKNLLLQQKTNLNNIIKNEKLKDLDQQCQNKKQMVAERNEKNDVAGQNKDEKMEEKVKNDASQPSSPLLKTSLHPQNGSNQEKYDIDFESGKNFFNEELKSNSQNDKNSPSSPSSIRSVESPTKSLSSPKHKSPLTSPTTSSLSSTKKSSISPKKSLSNSPTKLSSTKSSSPAKSLSPFPLPSHPHLSPPPPPSHPPQAVEKAANQHKLYNSKASTFNKQKVHKICKKLIDTSEVSIFYDLKIISGIFELSLQNSIRKYFN